MTKWAIGLCIVLLAGCKRTAETPRHKKLNGHAVSDHAGQNADDERQTIVVPGKRMGALRIDQNADSVVKRLGKPDYSDAAMGKALLKWNNFKGGHLVVFIAQKMGVEDYHRFKMIRSGSPVFKTEDELGVGSSLKSLRARFNLKNRGIFHSNNEKQTLWVDDGEHIGFEIDADQTCRATIVFAKGYPPENLYIALYKDFEKTEE